MKWIKASERLPEGTSGFAKQIITKWEYQGYDRLAIYTANQLLDKMKEDILFKEICFWLDESDGSDREMDEFRKWLRTNDHAYFADDMDALYEEFESIKPPNPQP